MTEFLVKIFIKDHENTGSSAVRTRYGIFASIVGIIVNLLLSAVKFTIGLLSGAVSIVSDAVNNLSDAAANIMSFIGIKLADRPADDDHPFGHGRMEYITALIVAFLILLVGWEFLKTSIEAIIHPNDLSFSLVGIIILGVSLFGKLFLAIFYRKLGKKIDSKVLTAAASDAVGDICITSVTIAAMIVFAVFKINIDGYAGVIVSAMILWAGIGIVKDTLQPLIGEQSDPEMRRKIKEFVESYEGVVGSHDLIVHSYGPNHNMATIHAEVSDTANIVVCHELMDKIEHDCQNKLGIVLVIHMDPVSSGDQAKQYREWIETTLRAIDPTLLYHDFRFVDGENRINLIFDIVCQRHMRAEEEELLKAAVEVKLQEYDPRFKCVITVDYIF